jgi:nicotinate-nucleotide adenylyltransferase
MGMLRLGIMGGTFDPIHSGHLFAAEAVAKNFKLDSIIFIPAGDPWQKTTYASAQHRLAMTKLAIQDHSSFQVSTIEIDRAGPTYTIDTLQQLHELSPDAELFFITGADSLSGIGSWKQVEKLWPLATFIGVSRPGHELKAPNFPGARLELLEIPALEVSSTEIRAKVNSGESLDGLVPEKVSEYIKEQNLYQGAE